MSRLGGTYHDIVTGFTGIATGEVVYLTGCRQVLIQPMCGEDGTFREPMWLDQDRLERMQDMPVIQLDAPAAAAGFDKPPPRR